MYMTMEDDIYGQIEKVFHDLNPLRDAQKTLGRDRDPKLENREAALAAIRAAETDLDELKEMLKEEEPVRGRVR